MLIAWLKEMLEEGGINFFTFEETHCLLRNHHFQLILALPDPLGTFGRAHAAWQVCLKGSMAAEF